MAPKSVLCFVILFVGVHCNVIGHPDLDVIEILKTTQNASDIAPDSFISGGTPVRIPWIARLSIIYRKEGAIYEVMCGGSLISKRFVLTAAHCVHLEEIIHISVYLLDYNKNSFPLDCVGDECTLNIMIFADLRIRHAQYNPSTIENDIALLRLQIEAPLGDALQAIALPPFDIDHADNDGVDVVVAGWGTTENGSLSDILLTTQLHLIAQEKCLRLNTALPRGHLCAGDSNGRDTCSGDSGGPLMMYYKKNYYLSGVVSYGPSGKCGTAEVGYYTNVYKYMNWIQTSMRVYGTA